jgi:hypothetical protein
MNKDSLKDIKQIIHSIFISGNELTSLPQELCNDYCEQILEVIEKDGLRTGT